MTKQVVIVRAFILGALVCVGLASWLPIVTVSATDEPYLTVRFLDVGQGDSIHITTPDGFEMLIDGGPSSGVLRELAEGRNYFDKHIDIVAVTHPDTDHVAGLVDVLERYDVGMILETPVEHDASAARAFDRAAEAEGADVISAQAGQLIQLGASTTVRILSPEGDTTNWESNASSIILQVVYGEIEFMLTGDAPSGIEDYLVGAYGTSLTSDVLKLGHHGSKTSTGENFLQTVKPDFAIVSASIDNRYGHPSSDVINRTSKAGVKILSTAEHGTITLKSNGKEVWVE